MHHPVGETYNQRVQEGELHTALNETKQIIVSARFKEICKNISEADRRDFQFPWFQVGFKKCDLTLITKFQFYNSRQYFYLVILLPTKYSLYTSCCPKMMRETPYLVEMVAVQRDFYLVMNEPKHKEGIVSLKFNTLFVSLDVPETHIFTRRDPE